MAVRESENLLGERLVIAMRLAAANPESGGSDHHLHRCLPEVKTIKLDRLSLFGQHKRNGGSRPSGPTGAWPHAGKLLHLPSVRYDDKVPRLAVARRRRSSAGLENLPEVVFCDRIACERSDLAT